MLAPSKRCCRMSSTNLPVGTGSGEEGGGARRQHDVALVTFCVDLHSTELQIAAHWGHYHRDRSAEGNALNFGVCTCARAPSALSASPVSAARSPRPTTTAWPRGDYFELDGASISRKLPRKV